MLNQSCILEENFTWLWYIIDFIYCCIQIANIWLKDIGLCFLVIFLSNFSIRVTLGSLVVN